MKFSKKILFGLSALSVMALLSFPNTSKENNFKEYARAINVTGMRFQQNESEEGFVEVSETYVQSGTYNDGTTTHNYIRFATAVNLGDGNGINTLEYLRKVEGVNDTTLSVTTVYKRIAGEDGVYYSYGDEGLTTEETANSWYFACYTVELTKEEYMSKDFVLSLRVNEEVYAYTAASLNTLNGDYYIAKFVNDGNLLGKHVVLDNEVPTYLGEELTKEADDHTYTFGWDKEVSPTTEDVNYNVAFIKNHVFGEGIKTGATRTLTGALYEESKCTVDGCEEKHSKEVGYVFQTEHAQRLYPKTLKVEDAQTDPSIRLNNGNYMDYMIWSEKEANVSLVFGMVSRQAYGSSDFSPFDLYTIDVNDIELEASEDTTKLTATDWGSKWKAFGESTVGTVHLNKGVNFIKVESKATNKAHLDYVKIEYKDDTNLLVPNIAKFDGVDAETINYVSTNGVATSGRNGIITDSAYLSDYTDGSNVRMNTTDYIEFSFVASEDVEVSLALETSYRQTISVDENKSIFDTYKVFLKEDGQEDYEEIQSTNEKAYDQPVKSSTTYGEFHTVRVCKFSLKAGVTHTLKLQARINLHIESIGLVHTTNSTISLIK